ncbi:MAG TPA: TetR/AcrR family transcriptional regulator [Candidatus Udaeobacter sp.]|nr:TetR/AcrR family transcriptional regulator [Candidatus Udaeobacter sp.]
MSQPQQESSNPDRPSQILDAALICFGKRGFHQASMHDISAEAGISVGLIYRYFENKEAVISAMADRHKKEIGEMLERARQAPTLLESLEILFTAHCCEDAPQVVSAFVVDLYAEASRNPRVADLVRDVLKTAMDGVTQLIARAPETQNATHGLSPTELAELIFAVARGMLMFDVLRPQEMTAAERRARQLEVTRTLWRLLFKPEAELAYA